VRKEGGVVSRSLEGSDEESYAEYECGCSFATVWSLLYPRLLPQKDLENEVISWGTHRPRKSTNIVTKKW
jgi:hypothetical protein